VTKVFIICPVREAPPEIMEQIRAYVAKLETDGCQVHWPPRDTDQSDPHGINICLTNCDGIIDADEVHIWFDPASHGSDFDRGILFALLRVGFPKKVVLINPVEPTPHKSFANVLLALANGQNIGR